MGGTLGRVRKLTLADKTLYGFGQVAEGVKNGSFELFLFFYYTQVLGLAGTLAGLATLVALCFDAVTDPLAGSFSDGFRHRWGRRHPFMYAAAVPLGVFFALLFAPPGGLGQSGLFAWMLGFLVLTRASMTLFHVPHMSLGAELSRDYRERTTIVAFRTFFGIAGSALCAVVGLGYFFRAADGLGSGQLEAAHYPAFAATCGVVMGVAVLLTALGTHAHIPRLPQPGAAQERFSLGRFVSDLRAALENPSFRAVFIGLVIFFVMRGVQTALALHMGTYFWEITSDEILAVTIALMVGFVLGIPVWTVVAARMDKKPTFLTGVVCFSLGVLVPPVAKIVGFFPASDSSAYLGLLLFFSVFAGFAGSAGLVTAGSMLADIADAHELRTGRRQEGIFFGANSFAVKSAIGVGGQIAGIGLDLIGFPAGAAPGTVSDGRVLALGVLAGPGVAALAIVAVVFLSRYRLGRAEHAEIVRKLEARRAAGRRAVQPVGVPASGAAPGWIAGGAERGENEG